MNRHVTRVGSRPLGLSLLLSLTLLSALGCDGDGAPGVGGGEAGGEAGGRPPQVFDDHTTARIPSVERFEELSVDDGESGSIVKFLLSGFQPDEPQGLRFLDGGFYALHDEVYWMRLLNGLRVWGLESVEPVRGLSVPTVAEAYLWALRQRDEGLDLPLDLTFTAGGRLYSPYFYRVALGRPRHIALGTVLHIPARAGRVRPEELWAFELEYSDEPTPAEVESMRERLRSALPPEASDLMWLTRSPQQEEVASQMERERLAGWDRVVSYPELTTPGEVRVYSEGLTAGRLYVIRAGEERPTLPSRTVLLFDHVPDELPATQGLITTVPQTPLAHINLLAQNRGIPNLYVSGLMTTPLVSQVEPLRPGVILWAKAPDEWRLEPLTQEEYQAYERLVTPPARELPAVELSSQPLTYALEDLTFAQSRSLRSVLGGKASGLVSCLESELPTPYRPLVVTGRAYQEHLAPVQAQLEALLTHYAFADERVRALCLEGRPGFMTRFPRPQDHHELEELITSLRAERGEEDPVVWWSARGGVQAVIREQAIDGDTLRALMETLRERFEALSPLQGLRFRSSSNVEDLEGFNGAGLYSSETGYLYPQAQAGSARSKSVAWALREVWASYWGVEAYQERAREGVSHLSGHMSALVHPNFQDELERSNGVVILTLAPPVSDQLPEVAPMMGSQLIATATINSQAGALSVTNPERPGALPEVIEVSVSVASDASPELSWPYEGLAQPYSEWSEALELRVERVQSSTERATVLSDEQARTLALGALEASARWLTVERRRAPSSQATRFLTLDLEFRGVDASWPLARRAPSEVGGGEERLVLKQARPLEPWSRGLGGELLELAVPRDLIRRARRIERVTCALPLPEELGGGEAHISAHQLYTNPLMRPDLGYEERPFTIDVRAEGWPAQAEGEAWYVTHEEVSFTTSEVGGAWALRVIPRYEPAGPSPLAYLSISTRQDGGVEVSWINAGDSITWSAEGACEREPLFAEPSEFLRGLLEQRGVGE